MNENTSTAKTIYILYLVSIAIGLTGIIGIIMAYINKEDAADWLKAHYQFQIRTFWIGLLYLFIAGITLPVGIGYFIAFFCLIWLIVRCIKGMHYLEKKQAPANINSWFLS